MIVQIVSKGVDQVDRVVSVFLACVTWKQN